MYLQVVEEQQEERLDPNRPGPHTLLSSLAYVLFSRAEAQAADHAVGSAVLLLPQPAYHHSQLVCLLPHRPCWCYGRSVSSCSGEYSSLPALPLLVPT